MLAKATFAADIVLIVRAAYDLTRVIAPTSRAVCWLLGGVYAEIRRPYSGQSLHLSQ